MVRNEEHTAMPKKLTCAPRGGDLMLLLGKNVANCLMFGKIFVYRAYKFMGAKTEAGCSGAGRAPGA